MKFDTITMKLINENAYLIRHEEFTIFRTTIFKIIHKHILGIQISNRKSILLYHLNGY